MQALSWKRWYGVRSYARFSLWLVPFVSIPFAMAATRIVHQIGMSADWQLLELAAPGARAMLETIVTATLSFSVFTFGSLLVALQIASGQLTPRVIATTLLRDSVVKYAVGLFIFTLLFSLSVLDRMEAVVNQFAVFVAAILGLSSFVVFLYLIDYAARLLRPISILARVGSDGIRVIESVYPSSAREPLAEVCGSAFGPAGREVPHDGTSQIVTAVNLPVLAEEAGRRGGELLITEVETMAGSGKRTTTGQLGDVMKESAELAFSYIRSRADSLGILTTKLRKTDIHIHLPENALPKDGPSAGVTLVTSIVSALTGIPVRKDVAMTGEITLRGLVLQIGGLKEKLLAAKRGGIKEVVIPKENAKDLADVPAEITNNLKITPVEYLDEVIQIALTKQPKGLTPEEIAAEERRLAALMKEDTPPTPAQIAEDNVAAV